MQPHRPPGREAHDTSSRGPYVLHPPVSQRIHRLSQPGLWPRPASPSLWSTSLPPRFAIPAQPPSLPSDPSPAGNTDSPTPAQPSRSTPAIRQAITHPASTPGLITVPARLCFRHAFLPFRVDPFLKPFGSAPSLHPSCRASSLLRADPPALRVGVSTLMGSPLGSLSWHRSATLRMNACARFAPPICGSPSSPYTGSCWT